MSAPRRTLSVARQRRPPLRRASDLRTVMGRFVTGVTVLSAGGTGAHGMTANAVTSLSLDPPLLLICVARAARLHGAVLAVRSFGVSVLAADQADAARHFADWRRPAGIAQFDAVPHRLGTHTGSPLLTGALAWLECTLDEVHPGGDHSVFVGRVVGCGLGDVSSALAFFGGDYHDVDPAHAVPAPRKVEP